MSLFIDAVAQKPLAVGDNGTTVIFLQDFLRRYGIETVADSAFGKITEAAVKQFQSENDLPADGIVNQKTAQALEAAVFKKETAARDAARDTERERFGLRAN